MTPEQQRKIIDYYFTEPNSKAVLEDEDIGATREEIEDFLDSVYEFLILKLPILHKEVGDETRIKELTKTLDKYGQHLEGCSKPICDCGWHQVLCRELTRESEALGLYENVPMGGATTADMERITQQRKDDHGS